MKKSLFLCVIACVMEICQTACEAEEGTTFKLNCSRSSNTSDLHEQQWTITNSSNNVTVITQCSPNNICNSIFAPVLTSQLVDSDSILTIADVSRIRPFNMETTWSCQWQPHPSVTVCPRLYIYAKPRNVSCALQSVNTTTNQYQVACTIERVYPKPICTLRTSRDNVTFLNAGSYTSTVAYNPNEIPTYYSASCFITLSNIFFFGKNYIRVRVYPSFPNGNIYFVESKTFLIITVPSDSLPDTTTPMVVPLSTRSDPGPANDTIHAVHEVSKTTETGPMIGLGVAFAISAVVAITLCVLMVCYWFRYRQKPTPTEIPERYDRMNVSLQNSECTPEHQYEHVNNLNATHPTDHGQRQQVTKGKQNTYANTIGSDQHQQEQENDTYLNLKGGNQYQQGQENDIYLNETL